MSTVTVTHADRLQYVISAAGHAHTRTCQPDGQPVSESVVKVMRPHLTSCPCVSGVRPEPTTYSATPSAPGAYFVAAHTIHRGDTIAVRYAHDRLATLLLIGEPIKCGRIEYMARVRESGGNEFAAYLTLAR